LSSVSAAHHRLVLEFSPVVFRRVAFAAVGVLILIVATGATVRLTGSGLGCPHWPTCTTKHALPRGYHSDIEFANRVVSAVTVITTLVLALAAWRTRGLSRRGRWLATAVFAGTLAQAPLGAIVVYFDLNPYLVITHLLLSFTLVALGVLTLLEAWRLVRGDGAPLPAIARLGSLVLVVAVVVLAVSGTAATAAGRFPGSSGSQVVPRLGSFYPAVYWHVRAVAAFGIVFLVLTAWAWTRRRACPWLLRACAGLLAILAVQMTVGEVQYRTYGDVPWWLVLLHVATAAILVGWTVGLATRIWRPVAARNAD
jgi:cytochrome c oxidase assembly protein subunit 15